MVDVKLVSLPGDGIGTEVVNATIGVLKEAGERWGARFIVEPVEAGAARYARTGVVYSEADFEICRAADVILMGELGLPDILHRDGTEAGPDLQFRLRFDLDLYAGVRPIRRYDHQPYWFREPTSGRVNLHIHGEVSCDIAEESKVRRALRKAGGRWKQTGARYQAHTRANPDNGHVSYAFKNDPRRAYRVLGIESEPAWCDDLLMVSAELKRRSQALYESVQGSVRLSGKGLRERGTPTH